MPERTTVLYDYNGARLCLCALMLKEVGYQDVLTYQDLGLNGENQNYQNKPFLFMERVLLQQRLQELVELIERNNNYKTRSLL